MSTSPEDWRDSLVPEEIKELDADLIHQLNQEDTGGEDDEQTTDKIRAPILRKFIGLLVILAFMVTIWSNWLWILSALPLDFLAKSGELSKNPDIRELQRAVVMITVSGRQGTGFNIDPHGLIITNEHVIKGAGNVDIRFPDSSFYSGSVVANYPEADLAVVRIDGRNLPWLQLKQDADPAIGDEVIIIGNPLGFADVVMQGEVAGQLWLKGWQQPVVEVKGQVRPGSSGSPVLNNNGQVVAVVFGTLGSAAAGDKKQTTGLAVSVKYLTEFLDSRKINPQ